MLDPKTMADWQIAFEKEKTMKYIHSVAAELGIEKKEVIPYGAYMAKIDAMNVLKRTCGNTQGKYIDVTAITPTPLGEGKSTTTIGLLQGFGKIGKKVSAAIRQPSSGPTFNIKGSAAGGGLAQCIPLEEFSLGLTGDIEAITNAHNLAMVALTSRMQHEYNYDDAILAKKRLKRLSIDPCNVSVGFAIDFCAQSLREIIIGLGGKNNGFMMKSFFQISVSSELMAILALSKDLKDMRQRIAKMVLAYTKKGETVTTADLEVDGAMCAIMIKTINPTLIQSLEGQPVFVHAGPFANIAIGQSSIIADRLGLALSDYHITESGFGSDIGFEKFANIKCRVSALTPNACVIVATIRSLKMHGGGPPVVPGKDLDEVYKTPNVELTIKGCENLLAHIDIVKRFGVEPVVCINHFYTDTDDEVDEIKKLCENYKVRCALSKHWELGGNGALELAEKVADACGQKQNFNYLYDEKMDIEKRIESIAKNIYGAADVSYTAEAKRKLENIQKDASIKDFLVCMVKTHLSISHIPSEKGRPHGFTLPVRDITVFKGAGFIVPIAGDISLMPGTASDAAFRKIDVDTDTGRVKGLF